MDTTDIERGDEIWLECDSSHGDGHYATVTSLQMKIDIDTREIYNLIRCGDHHFDARTGLAVTPPTMYYISSK